MYPRRPSCSRLTARRATPPTPPPSRPGWGRARAWRTFRCGRWSGPFAGPPPPSTATGLAGDQLVAIRAGHRAAFTQAAQATASRARRLRRLVRRRPGHHYPRPVASPGLALPSRYRAGGAGPGQPLPAGRGRRPRRCEPGHTRYQPAQPAADTPPDRRLHGRTVAQALGDANLPCEKSRHRREVPPAVPSTWPATSPSPTRPAARAITSRVSQPTHCLTTAGRTCVKPPTARAPNRHSWPLRASRSARPGISRSPRHGWSEDPATEPEPGVT
jgi:hypothetical protein